MPRPQHAGCCQPLSTVTLPLDLLLPVPQLPLAAGLPAGRSCAKLLSPAVAGCGAAARHAARRPHHSSCSAFREDSSASAAAGGRALQPSRDRLSRPVNADRGARPAAVWRASTRVKDSKPVSCATCTEEETRTHDSRSSLVAGARQHRRRLDSCVYRQLRSCWACLGEQPGQVAPTGSWPAWAMTNPPCTHTHLRPQRLAAPSTRLIGPHCTQHPPAAAAPRCAPRPAPAA